MVYPIEMEYVKVVLLFLVNNLIMIMLNNLMKLLKNMKLKLTLNSQRLEYQDLMQTLQNTIAELEL